MSSHDKHGNRLHRPHCSAQHTTTPLEVPCPTRTQAKDELQRSDYGSYRPANDFRMDDGSARNNTGRPGVSHPHSSLASRKILIAMSGLGPILDTDIFHLHHLDLQVRNIMVDIPDENTCNITGGKENEHMVNAESTEPKYIVAKSLLHEMETNEWEKYAFGKYFILTRRMFLLLRNGLFECNSYDDAERIISEWRELHLDKGLRKDEFGFLDSDLERLDPDDESNADSE
ncbi:hypothetical protein CC78DRAFT_588126 [Lojkania enalia]|uniref:Uncharacterized protein n=1 Tax=Lojkania enalia TaxID=147567 RepID=A0A9P4N413_9PLEO|nr:hypothetical protein CC78DRAFT_588126 [Didymosphaeria enalia]